MEQLQADSETVQAMREQYYKPEYDQIETRHLQYGLIAEEVAGVYPLSSRIR